MRLALILVSALGAAPAQQPQEVPTRVLVQQGQSFVCQSPGGCYVANGAGLDLLVREVVEATLAQCRKARSL